MKIVNLFYKIVSQANGMLELSKKGTNNWKSNQIKLPLKNMVLEVLAFLQCQVLATGQGFFGFEDDLAMGKYFQMDPWCKNLGALPQTCLIRMAVVRQNNEVKQII